MYKLMTMDTFFFLTSSISTVHFYRVDKEEAEDASDALERATRELWARVHRLLRTHAFLAGRIISHDDGMMMATCPAIGETLPDGNFREFIGEEYALRIGMSQAEMRRRALDRALIKCARDCVDKDEPLFAVSVVAESRSASHFAVITSMSHGIADGRTFLSYSKSSKRERGREEECAEGERRGRGREREREREGNCVDSHQR